MFFIHINSNSIMIILIGTCRITFFGDKENIFSVSTFHLPLFMIDTTSWVVESISQCRRIVGNGARRFVWFHLLTFLLRLNRLIEEGRRTRAGNMMILCVPATQTCRFTNRATERGASSALYLNVKSLFLHVTVTAVHNLLVLLPLLLPIQ